MKMSRNIVLNQTGRFFNFSYVYMPFAHLLIKKPRKIQAVKIFGLKVFLILSFLFKIINSFSIQGHVFNFLVIAFKYFFTLQ